MESSNGILRRIFGGICETIFEGIPGGIPGEIFEAILQGVYVGIHGRLFKWTLKAISKRYFMSNMWICEE